LVTENLTDVVWTARIEGTPNLADIAGSGPDAVDFDRLLDRWQFTFVSPSVQHILGYSVEEIMQLRPRQLLTPVSYAALRERLAIELRGLPADPAGEDRRRTRAMEHVTRDGRRKWCEITSTFIRDERGVVTGFEGVTRDISERKRFERELSQVITRQQQQTGQELHDGLAQQLVGVRLLAHSLHQALDDQSHAAAGSAAELITALHDAETSVRQLIMGVRPVEVAANGLMAALADLVEGTQQLSGIGCKFHCQRRVAIEDSHTATQLFYIAREAVHNATKHAAARRISVDLFSGDGQLRLTVADDGRGMPDDAAPAEGMGLQIMRYRAGVIGASLMVNSAPGQGTLVTCTLPLESNA
jgi:PAS domain S-box-containing protein